jgi:ubiquinone/menaquinone biosynthesis C-methylase UbiE
MMIGDAERQTRYPWLMKIVDLISAQNPLQGKRIGALLDSQDERYYSYAENLCETLGRTFLTREEDWVAAARSYNRMCMDILREQIRFRKTGDYLIEDAAQAHDEVYSQPEIMNYYMVGLLLSYLFWRNHYGILCFFQDSLKNIGIKDYLEIAPGHGLFTIEALRRSPQAKVSLMDISQTSLDITCDLLKTFEVDISDFRMIRSDFLKEAVEEQSVDFIAMGEVLEHVNEAPEFMRRAYRWLKPEGTIFMTTCANCPALDHVYHFHNVSEIRTLMRNAGFIIMQDIAMPAEDIPEERWQAELVTINYAAMLKKV